MPANPRHKREWLKYRYLDASALVKLYVDEPNSEHVRQFVGEQPKPFQTTAFCFAEAMSVLKRKWLWDELTTAKYLNIVRRLTIDAWGKVIEIQDYGVSDPFLHGEVARIVERYKVDVADALQLITMQQGVHSHMVAESASVLITADKGLAAAATGEGVRVWDCGEGPAPDWA